MLREDLDTFLVGHPRRSDAVAYLGMTLTGRGTILWRRRRLSQRYCKARIGDVDLHYRIIPQYDTVSDWLLWSTFQKPARAFRIFSQHLEAVRLTSFLSLLVLLAPSPVTETMKLMTALGTKPSWWLPRRIQKGDDIKFYLSNRSRTTLSKKGQTCQQ